MPRDTPDSGEVARSATHSNIGTRQSRLLARIIHQYSTACYHMILEVMTMKIQDGSARLDEARELIAECAPYYDNPLDDVIYLSKKFSD